jgi:integrase
MRSQIKAVNFTPTTLNRILAAKVERRTHYRDSKQPGLRLRVSPSGAAAWYVVKKLPGAKAPTYVKLGDARTFSPDQARTKARANLAEIEAGRNPNEKRRGDELARKTLREVFDAFCLDRGKKLKASTTSDYAAKLHAGFEDWLDRPISEITQAKVLARHKELSERGATSCNVRFRVLRALMNYAAATLKVGDTAILTQNPVDVLGEARLWHRNNRKDRIVPDDKLGAWVDAVNRLENENARVALTCMLFLGLRRGEAFGMRWEDLNLEANPPMLTLPDPKNRRPHQLPLSATVAHGLTNLRATTGHTPWVFPKGWDRHGKLAQGPIADVAAPLARVNAKTNLAISYHDLRRTFATLSNALGHPDLTTKKLFNHADSGNVTSGYVQLEIRTKAAALAGIEAHILARLREFRGVQQC